ncbi:MAG: phosphonate C-P lyase system protein PhnG [Acidimicrobiales bacterium]
MPVAGEADVTASPERRAELLSVAPADLVVALAERCVADDRDLVVVSPPEVGMVMLTIREPIAQERFHLAEVLVTRAEVELDAGRGWSMRLGDDRLAALASAVLDAEVDCGGPLAAAVIELCGRAEREATNEKRREWDELLPTEVRFDELD